MVALFGVASEGPAPAKVVADSRDAQLGFRQPFDVAREQARKNLSSRESESSSSPTPAQTRKSSPVEAS